MKLGTWTGLLAGYKSVQEKEEARREKEDELLKKRNELIGRLRPTINQGLQKVETMRSDLSYLKNRGLSDATINAFGQDPEKLQSAVEFARTKGADLPAEKLNDIYRISSLDSTEEGEDVFARLDRMKQAYEGVPDMSDPQTFEDPLSVPVRRTAVVEERLPKEPKEPGISPTRARTQEEQVKVFDATLLDLANRELQELSRKKDEGTAGEEDLKRRQVLLEDLSEYSSDLDTRIRLTGQYRDRVIGLMVEQAKDDPDFLAGLNNNRIIFNPASQEAQEDLESFESSPVEPDLNVPLGTRVIDGVTYYVYQNPDGSIIQRKTLR